MIPLGSYDLSDLKILESLIVKDQQNHTLLQYVCFVVLLYFDIILFYLFMLHLICLTNNNITSKPWAVSPWSIQSSTRLVGYIAYLLWDILRSSWFSVYESIEFRSSWFSVYESIEFEPQSLIKFQLNLNLPVFRLD